MRTELFTHYFEFPFTFAEEKVESEVGRTLQLIRNRMQKELMFVMNKYFSDKAICNLALNIIPEG